MSLHIRVPNIGSTIVAFCFIATLAIFVTFALFM